MSFLDVDEKELDLVLILIVELVERGNLPAEGRSSITAKYQHNGFLTLK